MRTWIVLAALSVSVPARAQIVSNHPPLSPAEAVAVLRASHSPVDRTGLYLDAVPLEANPPVLRGDDVPQPAAPPPPIPRRLDGSYVTDPPWFQSAYVGQRYAGVAHSRGQARQGRRR